MPFLKFPQSFFNCLIVTCISAELVSEFRDKLTGENLRKFFIRPMKAIKTLFNLYKGWKGGNIEENHGYWGGHPPKEEWG